jgi:hypothetical protein
MLLEAETGHSQAIVERLRSLLSDLNDLLQGRFLLLVPEVDWLISFIKNKLVV